MELTQLIERAVEIRDALPLPNVKQRGCDSNELKEKVSLW
jgi:hypothetical protein